MSFKLIFSWCQGIIWLARNIKIIEMLPCDDDFTTNTPVCLTFPLKTNQDKVLLQNQSPFLGDKRDVALAQPSPFFLSQLQSRSSSRILVLNLLNEKLFPQLPTPHHMGTASCTPKRKAAKSSYFYDKQNLKTKRPTNEQRKDWSRQKQCGRKWQSCAHSTHQQCGKEWLSCTIVRYQAWHKCTRHGMTQLLVNAPMQYRKGTAWYSREPKLSPAYNFTVCWLVHPSKADTTRLSTYGNCDNRGASQHQETQIQDVSSLKEGRERMPRFQCSV